MQKFTTGILRHGEILSTFAAGLASFAFEDYPFTDWGMTVFPREQQSSKGSLFQSRRDAACSPPPRQKSAFLCQALCIAYGP